MIFTETKLKGAYVVEPKLILDDRGFFARMYCKNVFREKGLNFNIVQSNMSQNKLKGTLRGLHYQIAPKSETKLVSCVKGAILDVIVDLRKESSTYCEWVSVELNEENHKMLYVPKGFAHGYLVLKDDSVVFYHVDEFYTPELEGGLRWNDPKLGIKWPIDNPILSDKDNNHPLM